MILYSAVYYRGPRWEIVDQNQGIKEEVDKYVHEKDLSAKKDGLLKAEHDVQLAGPMGKVVIFYRPVPTPFVSDQQLKHLAKQIEQRERSDKPMTPEEIEQAIH